jgi:hypothetical protein
VRTLLPALTIASTLLLVTRGAAAQPSDATSAPAPAGAQTQAVVVHIEAPQPVTLEVLDRDDDWQPVCTSPCDKPLPSTETYRITGSGIRDSKKFGLDAGAPQTLKVDPSSSGGHAMAIVVTVLGSAGLVPGAGVTALIVGGEIAGFILICPLAVAFVPKDQQNSEFGNCLGGIATFFGQAYASPWVWAPALASVVLLPTGIVWLVKTPPTAVQATAARAAMQPLPPLLPPPPTHYDALALPAPTIVPVIDVPF